MSSPGLRATRLPMKAIKHASIERCVGTCKGRQAGAGGPGLKITRRVRWPDPLALAMAGSHQLRTCPPSLPMTTGITLFGFSELSLDGGVEAALLSRIVPPRQEGRLAIVTNAGRDAVDALAPLTNGARGGRRSRVVLTPRRWRQVCGDNPASDGGKKARLTRKSTKETVKTIARGMPGVSGVTVVTNSSCFLFLHARLRAHRSPGIPCALCWAKGRNQPGRSSRCGNIAARHCERSEAIQRGRKTGLLRR